MKKTPAILAAACAMCAATATAALPSATEMFSGLTSLQERFADATNALAQLRENHAQLRADLAQLRENYAESRARVASLLAWIDFDKDRRKEYHGGKLQQYVQEDALGTVLIELYRDGTVWTNRETYAKGKRDPEAALKADLQKKIDANTAQTLAEKNLLPPEVAATLAERRAVEIENAAINVEVQKAIREASVKLLESRLMKETVATLTAQEKRRIRQEALDSLDREAIRREVEAAVMRDGGNAAE